MPVPKVDPKKCIGCGTCTAICPKVFELGDDGKSHVIGKDGNCNLKEVVESCPSGAISISGK
jgi:ferredoxin